MYLLLYSILPFCISISIIILYTLIIWKIKYESSNFSKTGHDRFMLLLKKSFFIILSNVCTWIPISIISFLAVIKKSFLTYDTYIWIFVLILPLNAILNIYIHFKFNIKISLINKELLKRFNLYFFDHFFF